MKLFGLIGEKLGHSLSPEIHNKVFKDNNIDGLYNLFSVKKDFENNIVESLKCLGVKGANVTIPAGALAKEILKEKGITIGSHIKQVGKVKDSSFDALNLKKEGLEELLTKELPVIDTNKIEEIKEEITSYRMEGDSIGGIVECAIVGLEAGIGNPFFDSLESTIAHLAFSVPAVKGIEFGAGFDFVNMKGSEANDEYFIEDEKVKTYSNNNGGITGGISNGMPVIFRVVIKPTPSISKEQRTINIKNMTEEVLSVNGRHDPCIVQRALVVIEAIAAISILELIK